jgi:hypothetical protein
VDALQALVNIGHKDLEGCGPSQPPVADINPVHGVAPLLAVADRKSTPVHCADGADALQVLLNIGHSDLDGGSRGLAVRRSGCPSRFGVRVLPSGQELVVEALEGQGVRGS